MHANIWQVLHYLKHGRHPEALVPRTDGRAMLDNIILITPNEGLSAQHLDEFRKSGLDASLMIEEAYASSGGMGFPDVKVIEIHKLADVPSRDGVSVVLDAVEPHNLVIVDEGHKGTGSEAQTWKNRQKRLSEKGFLLEYSATFAQAIGAAPTRKRKELIHEYGKSILFDYSYAHFYGDGYGKDFYVMNLSRGGVRQAHELLVGGLLTYYHQHWLFQRHQNEYRPYHIEKPLWVLLGSSVNAMYTRDKERRSDVAEVVSFLKRFLEEPDWAVEVIRKILKGDSGFQDRASGQDLLAPRVAYLRDLHPEDVYRQVKAELFHGSGGLEVVEIKRPMANWDSACPPPVNLCRILGSFTSAMLRRSNSICKNGCTWWYKKTILRLLYLNRSIIPSLPYISSSAPKNLLKVGRRGGFRRWAC